MGPNIHCSRMSGESAAQYSSGEHWGGKVYNFIDDTVALPIKQSKLSLLYLHLLPHLHHSLFLQLDIWHRTSPSGRGSQPTSPYSFFNQPHPPAHSPPRVPHTFRRFRPGFTSVNLDLQKLSSDGNVVSSKPLTANQLVLLTNNRWNLS